MPSVDGLPLNGYKAKSSQVKMLNHVNILIIFVHKRNRLLCHLKKVLIPSYNKGVYSLDDLKDYGL